MPWRVYTDHLMALSVHRDFTWQQISSSYFSKSTTVQ